MIPELGLIFDAGTGIYRARDLITTDTLDIFLSHVHLDHSVGLTFLLNVLHGKDMKHVRVHVDEEKVDVIKNHLYHPMLFPVDPSFEFCPFAKSGSRELSSTSSVDFFPMHHPGGSHGFVLQHAGKKIAYITDTTAKMDAEYIDAIRDVDLLIHECYFPDGWEDLAKLTGHSCLTPVAQIAKESGARRTVLVHINPLDESESPLDLDTVSGISTDLEVAHDNLVIDV